MKSSSALSAHWMSSKTRTVGALLGEPLEEHAARRRRGSPGRRRAPLLEAEQVREPRLDPAPLLADRDVLARRVGSELRAAPPRRPRPRRCRSASAPSRRAPSRRRRRRTRGSALGASRRRRRARRCTSRTPTTAATCRCRDADHRDELRLALLGRGVEELLDEAQLAVAADERRLERRSNAVAPPRPATTRSARQSCDRLRLALQLVLAGVLVGDRASERASVASPTSTVPGLGRRLDPRGRVDQVAGDHALALGARA